MLKIAICDDNSHELSRISNLITKYKEEKNISITYDSFLNPMELLESMKKKNYDILLLDVLMPGINGIEVAHEIREFNNKIEIIFLTSSPEFAVESYSVDAYYYLLKPATTDKLFPLLDKLLVEIQKIDDTLNIQSSSEIIRIPFNKLEFLEILNKKLLFHLTDGSIKKISGSLADYEQLLLSRPEFIKIYRSYIVNMEYIQELKAKEILTYTNQTLPVSRLLYANVRDTYMKHLFIEKGVE